MLVSEGISICSEDYMDDADNSLWNKASLIRFFAEAERQACNRSNLIYDDSTTAVVEVTLVDGQATYALSQKITYIETVLFEGNNVVHKTKEELDREVTDWRTITGMTGNTINAFVRGRNIRFSPIPDATDAGKIVYLEVYRLPVTDVNSVDDTFEIDTEYQRDLIYHVLYECYSKRDEDTEQLQRAQFYRAKFEEIFGNYVSAEIRLNQFSGPKSLKLRPIRYTANLHREADSSDWD